MAVSQKRGSGGDPPWLKFKSIASHLPASRFSAILWSKQQSIPALQERLVTSGVVVLTKLSVLAAVAGKAGKSLDIAIKSASLISRMVARLDVPSMCHIELCRQCLMLCRRARNQRSLRPCYETQRGRKPKAEIFIRSVKSCRSLWVRACLQRVSPREQASAWILHFAPRSPLNSSI